MKKILSILLISTTLLIMLIGCGANTDQKINDKPVSTDQAVENKTEKPISQTENQEIEQKEEYAEEKEEIEIKEEELSETKEEEIKEIEIVKEYTYKSGFWYTYHFVVVKNVGNVSLELKTDTLAYGKDGSIVSVDSGKVDIVDPGCTTIYVEAFETQDEIAKYETTTEVDRPFFYKHGTADLSYEISDIKNGKIIQVTNNGTEPIEFVKGYLLYFNNGDIVGWEDKYFTDDDHEIKPGKTITNQYTTYDDFDSVEFYLTGRR